MELRFKVLTARRLACMDVAEGSNFKNNCNYISFKIKICSVSKATKIASLGKHLLFICHENDLIQRSSLSQDTSVAL